MIYYASVGVCLGDRNQPRGRSRSRPRDGCWPTMGFRYLAASAFVGDLVRRTVIPSARRRCVAYRFLPGSCACDLVRLRDVWLERRSALQISVLRKSVFPRFRCGFVVFLRGHVTLTTLRSAKLSSYLYVPGQPAGVSIRASKRPEWGDETEHMRRRYAERLAREFGFWHEFP
jgi:hypothetical protein